MDVRDLRFWAKEASKKHLEAQVKRTQACRVAMAKDNDYSNYINGLREELRKLDYGEKEVIEGNWEGLKFIGRKRNAK